LMRCRSTSTRLWVRMRLSIVSMGEPRTENREPRTENRESRTENRELRIENREPLVCAPLCLCPPDSIRYLHQRTGSPPVYLSFVFVPTGQYKVSLLNGEQGIHIVLYETSSVTFTLRLKVDSLFCLTERHTQFVCSESSLFWHSRSAPN
jgi:hypothetical protein